MLTVVMDGGLAGWEWHVAGRDGHGCPGYVTGWGMLISNSNDDMDKNKANKDGNLIKCVASFCNLQ